MPKKYQCPDCGAGPFKWTACRNHLLVKNHGDPAMDKGLQMRRCAAAAAAAAAAAQMPPPGEEAGGTAQPSRKRPAASTPTVVDLCHSEEDEIAPPPAAKAARMPAPNCRQQGREKEEECRCG